MKDFLSSFARRATLRQLRAFAAVVQHGTVSAAAERLALTPPAVSLQVRQLEATLEVPLFERTPDGARPTEAGREVLATAARIEGALADCAAAIEALRGLDRGRAAVGIVSTAKYFAPRALAAFKKTHPRVDIRVLVGNREETIAGLEGFELDFAIMGRPPEHLDVEQAAIGDHPHVIIAPPEHPLAGRRRIALAALAQETFLLREAGSGTRVLTQRLFLDAGLDPPVAMEIGSNETIKQAVMAGLGIALLSAHTIAAEVEDRRLAILQVAGLPIVRQWFLVKRSEKRLLPGAEALWRFLARSGRDLMPSVELCRPRRPR